MAFKTKGAQKYLIVLIVAVVAIIIAAVYLILGSSLVNYSGSHTGNYSQAGNYSVSNYSAGNSSHASSYYPTTDLASCQGTELFNVSPAVPGTYKYLEPLGHTSSYDGNAGHVIPADHMYFYFTDPQNSSPSDIATIVAPANVEIYNIVSKTYVNNGIVTSHDYQIWFSPCTQVYGLFDHVDRINSTLQTAITDSKQRTCSNFTTGPGSPTYETCNYAVNLKLKAGQEIGTAGGPNVSTYAFDFGVYDLRNPPLPFVDQKLYSYSLYAVCGISYFKNGSVKNGLYNSLETTLVEPNGLKDCGSNMWDKAGTIQGNWIIPGSQVQGVLPDNQYGLSIAPMDTNPSENVIDWGGMISPANRISFTPTNSGTVNRNPANVTADGNIYCYQDINSSTILYIQLINSTAMKIEFHTSSCPSNPSFSNAMVYVR